MTTRETILEEALTDTLEALIKTNPELRVEDNERLERLLRVVGPEKFDPIGRVRAVLKARAALASPRSEPVGNRALAIQVVAQVRLADRAFVTGEAVDRVEELLARSEPVGGVQVNAELVALRRALDTLENVGNHFDHDNPESAKEVVRCFFERWAKDYRALANAANAGPGKCAAVRPDPWTPELSPEGVYSVHDVDDFVLARFYPRTQTQEAVNDAFELAEEFCRELLASAGPKPATPPKAQVARERSDGPDWPEIATQRGMHLVKAQEEAREWKQKAYALDAKVTALTHEVERLREKQDQFESYAITVASALDDRAEIERLKAELVHKEEFDRDVRLDQLRRVELDAESTAKRAAEDMRERAAKVAFVIAEEWKRQAKEFWRDEHNGERHARATVARGIEEMIRSLPLAPPACVRTCRDCQSHRCWACPRPLSCMCSRPNHAAESKAKRWLPVAAPSAPAVYSIPALPLDPEADARVEALMPAPAVPVRTEPDGLGVSWCPACGPNFVGKCSHVIGAGPKAKGTEGT